ncbi:DUF4365 domain-containing protein [Dyella monticola]|uniref:DUF4365 domain-containing protein n=1 Tax=Dyella monticola TaxID=1927958 RepID=A0A370X9Q1_9GAMM|nr:DUF4365 domain-containing protein [Dyella monticola]RDS85022.1 DUF4365 domain-containing protein [Dyella monticola]
MRTYQDVIDTRSIKHVLSLLPDYWVIRELTERDYGIDLIVEIFEKIGTNKHGHDVFDSTGAVFHAQVKGTASALEPKKDGNFSFQLDKGALLYAERFSTPFMLFRVDVSSSSAKSYFLWIQRYVKDVLELERPAWRTEAQESFSLDIPPHNEIVSGLKKIEKIASRPRLIEETVEFCESYLHLSSQLDAVSHGQLNVNVASLKGMKLLARQINNLKVIFKYNDCCIDRSCATELLSFVDSLDLTSNPSAFSNFPHRDNFNLLASSLNALASVENFIAENEDDTAY